MGSVVKNDNRKMSETMNDAWGNFDEDEEERRHFHTVVTAFFQYKNYALRRILKSLEFVESLSDKHREYLKTYREHLSKVRWCIEENEEIVKLIVKDVANMFINISANADTELIASNICQKTLMRTEDIEKVQSVFKQIVRDWSEYGKSEREQCYNPIIDVIMEKFPNPRGVRVLVPGAGLGRLAFEIATRGYESQGNEFSLFMLFASNFILNKCNKVNSHKIYPWAHQYINNVSCEAQVKEIAFPDVDPSSLVIQDFSMVAGDFIKVYTEPNSWNCVATCFFIDCAPNIITFVETIYMILKPGGIWVNLGPLLYHYSDMDTQNSIEPPFDVLCNIIKEIGFEILEVKTGIETKYTQNVDSMLQYEYRSVFFVCKKPENTN